MDDPTHQFLTTEGQLRRDLILRQSLAAARSRGRWQTTGRVGAIALLIAAAAGVLLTRQTPAPPVLSSARPVIAPIQPQAPAAREPTVTWLKTDPDLLARVALPPQSPTWQVLSDDTFLGALASAGKPAGLATIGGETRILYRAAMH